MAASAAALVAGIIDQIEKRPFGIGRPPMPTTKVVEALQFFIREGVQWRDLRATIGRASGSTLRRRLDDWHASAVLRQVHVVLVRRVRAGCEVAACDVVVDELAADEISEEAIELGMARDTPELEIFESRQDLAGAITRVLDNSALDCRCAQDRN